MTSAKFSAPLTEAAVQSLHRAAKIAEERARATGMPLVVWKDGRVTHVRVTRGARKPQRTSTARNAAR